MDAELMKPLCIDLFCGLGGFSEGFLAEGYQCVGFDIERHDYGSGGYPSDLVLQDVLTLHGSQFKDATAIVASPPCTEYSYMAMPWSRAKQIARALRSEGDFPDGYSGSFSIAELNLLFNACFRIQGEASEAAGRHIPLIVENVRGAQAWVDRPAKWNYGSFYLWGDVPALMPTSWHTKHLTAQFESDAVREGAKGAGAGAVWFDQNLCAFSSRSNSRKAASAAIAKIPLALSRHIARTFLNQLVLA